MTYTKPQITDHGTLTEMTAQTTVGSQLDAAIPAGTPVNQIPAVTAQQLS